MSSKKQFTIRPFEKLRKTMERNAVAVAPPPPHQKKKEEYTDDEVFNSAMEDVQEIESFRALSCSQRRPKVTAPPVPRNFQDQTLIILDEIATGERPINLQDTQEYVEWTNPNYGNILTEQLHQGLFSVQAFLDLHGYTVAEAEVETDSFLREAYTKGLHCVKIIHGRGLRSTKGPRIKEAVIRKLLGRYRKSIVAYASAPQCDGGLGALYVLLSNR